MEPTSENTYPLDSIKEGADEPVANDTCDVTYESNPGDVLHIPAEGNLLQAHYINNLDSVLISCLNPDIFVVLGKP